MKKIFFMILVAIQCCGISRAAEEDIVLNNGNVVYILKYGDPYDEPGVSSTLHYAILDQILSYDATSMRIPDYIEHEGIIYPVMRIGTKALTGTPSLSRVVLGKNTGCWSDINKAISNGYFSEVTFEGASSVGVLYNSKLENINFNYSTASIIESNSYQYLKELTSIPATAMYSSCDIRIPNYNNALKEINIGCSVERANINCPYCYSLETINCMSPYIPECFIEVPDPDKITLHVPVGYLEEYKEAEGWNLFSNIIDDLDFEGNRVYEYILDDDIIYGYDGEEAYVVGSRNREISWLSISDTVYFPGLGYLPVKRIGTAAFKGCANLTYVSLSEGITKIGDLAFFDCPIGQDYNWSLPESIEIIGDFAFDGTYQNSSNLEKLPSSLISVGDDALPGVLVEGRDYITFPMRPNKYVLPDKLESIGNRGFSIDGSYVIDFPHSLKSIGSRALNSAYSFVSNNLEGSELNLWNAQITDLIYDSSLYTIKFNRAILPSCLRHLRYANLKANTIILGENIETIQENSIRACDELYILAENPPRIWDSSIGGGYTFETTTVHVRKGCLSKYKDNEIWSKFINIVEDLDYTTFADENFTYTIDLAKNEATIMKHNKETFLDDIEAPSSVHYAGVDYPVTIIGHGAFKEFWAPVKLPDTIKKVENFSLGSPSKVYCNAVTPPDIASCHFRTSYFNSSILYVPKETIEDYKNSEFGKCFTEILSLEEGSAADINVDKTGVVKVYDISGVEVYEGLLESAKLPAGIYIVRDKNATKKLFIR